MFENKLNIYKPEWIEIVFSGRNKKYGAYQLRKDNPKVITKALLYSSVTFILLLSTPMIVEFLTGLKSSEEEALVQTEVELMAPPPIDKSTPPPPPPPTEPPPPKVDQIKFPPPVVKPDEQVIEEEVPTVAELQKADPGQKTQEGDPDAEVVIDEPVGDGPKDGAIVEDEVMDVAFVEQQPEFPGGQEGFARHLQRNLRYPPIAKENNIQGRVYISFVVERDGSLTDIKVERGIGGGCDAEAVRVLKLTKGWKPGIQNGRPVRVKYTLPIVFQLSTD